MDNVKGVISDQNIYYLNQLELLDDLNNIIDSPDAVIKISKDDVGKIFNSTILCGYSKESIESKYLLDYIKFNDLEPTRCILNIRFNPKYHTIKFVQEIITKFKEKYKDVLVFSSVEMSKKASKEASLKAFFTSEKY